MVPKNPGNWKVKIKLLYVRMLICKSLRTITLFNIIIHKIIIQHLVPPTLPHFLQQSFREKYIFYLFFLILTSTLILIIPVIAKNIILEFF